MKTIIAAAVAALALTAGAASAANSWSGSSNQVGGTFGFSNAFGFNPTASWGGTEVYQHQAQAGAAGTVQIGPFQVPVSDSSAASSMSQWQIDGMAGANGGLFSFTSSGNAGGGAAASAGN